MMGRYKKQTDWRRATHVRIGREPWDRYLCHCDKCVATNTRLHGYRPIGDSYYSDHVKDCGCATCESNRELELVVCDKCMSKYTLVWGKDNHPSNLGGNQGNGSSSNKGHQAPGNRVHICECDPPVERPHPRRIEIRGRMASAPRLTELMSGDFLRCPLCSALYNNPVILPCLHSYCEMCIRQHMTDGIIDGVVPNDFQCPVCKTDHVRPSSGKNTVRPNHFLRSLKELAECQTVETKECDYCKFDKKNSRAIGRCLECQDNMCGECVEAHRRTKVTRTHKIAPFNEVQLGKYDEDIRMNQAIACPKHTEEPIKYYCAKCERLICRECKVTDHDKHHCMDLQYAADLYANKTKNAVQNVRNKVPGMDQYITFLCDYETHVKDEEERLLRDIDARAAHLHKMVDDHRDDLVSKIKVSGHKELQAIDTRNKQAKHILKVLDTTTTFLDNLFELGRPEEILIVKHLITDRLSQLGYMHVDAIATKVGMHFNTSNSSATNMDVVFGKLDIYNVPLSNDSVKTITKNEDISISTALPSVGDLITQLLVFDSKGTSDTKDIWPTGLAADDDGNMAVLDRENRRVKIFDMGGELIREFGNTTLGCPYDVTLMRNSNIAVTDYDEEDIKIFAPTGELVDTIKGSLKYPRGIATNRKGELVVVDCHSRKVTVHDPKTGAVTLTLEGKCADGSDMFTDPYYVTVNPNGQMIVTDWAAPNIKIFTPQGKVATKYGTYGSKKDQVLQPYGVVTDKFGYIFVADNQNHRIHLLAPDGKFIRFLITKQHGLWHPMALAINHDGNLVVTEALGKVKVFKYL